MHPAFNNCFLTFFGQPPVNHSFSAFSIFGGFEDSDRGRNVDYAFCRIGNFQRFFFGCSQFQNVFFQNHCSSIFASQQFVLNCGVTGFNADAVSFQFVEVFPTEFVSQCANCYISGTGEHRVRHSDFAFPFRIGQVSPGFRSVFCFQFVSVVSNDHVANTNCIPSTVFSFISDNVVVFFGFVRHEPAFFFQFQIVRGVSNHQYVGANFVSFHFAGDFGYNFFSAALEPVNFHFGESFCQVRFAHIVDDVRINRGINHQFAFNTFSSFFLFAATAASYCYGQCQ